MISAPFFLFVEIVLITFAAAALEKELGSALFLWPEQIRSPESELAWEQQPGDLRAPGDANSAQLKILQCLKEQRQCLLPVSLRQETFLTTAAVAPNR